MTDWEPPLHSRDANCRRMRKPSLLIIFLTVFIDLIGFGIVMPLLQIYSKRFGASGFMIGAVIASFSLMQFLFAPAWGKLSDRIGRRPVLLISNAGSAISYAMFALASSMTGSSGLWMLLASRVFAGICGANISVASAYIADVTPPEKRSKSMGLIGMAFGLGFIFGPVIGGLTAKYYGLAAPGWVAAAFCAGNFLLGCFILVESRKPNSNTAVARPRAAQWMHTLSRPTVGFLIGVYFLATFCFACFESTFGLLLAGKFQYDQSHISYLFAYCGILAAFIQGGAIGRMVKALGESRLIVASLVVTGLGMLLIPYVRDGWPLYLALGLFAGGSGVNRPPTFGLISILTPADDQGSTLGVAQSAGSLARIVAPIFANSVFVLHPNWPYITCAVLAVITAALAWKRLCQTPITPAAAPA